MLFGIILNKGFQANQGGGIEFTGVLNSHLTLGVLNLLIKKRSDLLQPLRTNTK